jgi:hypothetical protein
MLAAGGIPLWAKSWRKIRFLFKGFSYKVIVARLSPSVKGKPWDLLEDSIFR